MSAFDPKPTSSLSLGKKGKVTQHMISVFLTGHLWLGCCARGLGRRVTNLRLPKVARIDGHHLDRGSILRTRRHVRH
jgi:hypothetical protein